MEGLRPIIRFNLLINEFRNSGDESEFISSTEKILDENPDFCNYTSLKTGNNLLIIAISHNLTAIARLLINKYNLPVISQNRTKENALFLALKNGNIELISLLLERGEQSNHEKWIGNCKKSFLLWMVEKSSNPRSQEKHMEAIRTLLRHGAHINYQTEIYGWTPLLVASKGGSEPLIRLLIDNGADINQGQLISGWTPLHFVVKRNLSPSLVSMMMEKGAKYLTQEKNGWTPLKIAIHQKNEALTLLFTSCTLFEFVKLNKLEEVKMALKGKIVVMMSTSILHVAVESNCSEEILQVLLENQEVKEFVNQRDNQGFTPLAVAAVKGHYSHAKLLVDAGADSEIETGKGVAVYVVLIPSGYFPLILAAKKGHRKIVHLLLDVSKQDSFIHFQNKAGWTFLHYVCQFGDHESFGKIKKKFSKQDIKKFLNMATRDKGYLPLHLAICNKHEEIVRTLVKSGVDTSIDTSTKLTCLHLACIKELYSTVKLLVDNGAKDKKNSKGVTCLLLGTRSNNIEIVRYLLEHQDSTDSQPNTANEKGWTPMHEACKKQNLELIKLLVNRGGNWGIPDSRHNTPLHIAIQKGDFQILQLLLAKPEYLAINHANRGKWTALHFACYNRDSIVVRLLCENGAMVDAKDKSRLTPLHIAVRKNDISSVLYLLEFGAKVNATARGRKVPRTPLRMAVDPNMKVALIEHGGVKKVPVSKSISEKPLNKQKGVRHKKYGPRASFIDPKEHFTDLYSRK